METERGKMKLKQYIIESDEKIKRWLNAELQRTKGNNLSDYSQKEVNDLIQIYKKEKNIKKAVDIWSDI